MKQAFLSSFFLIFLFACTNSGIGEEKKLNTEHIFFDYKISGEEERESLNVVLQYRLGGASGRPLSIKETGKVELDGIAIEPDSAYMKGAFYERQVNLQDFTGKHIISFTDINGKNYKEEFEFVPFTLASEIPDSITRNDITIQFNGLKTTERLRIIIIDTAFYTNDINDIDTVENGQLIITANRLRNLKAGQLILQIFKEEELPIRNRTKAGGWLSISYALKRDLELKD